MKIDDSNNGAADVSTASMMTFHQPQTKENAMGGKGGDGH